MTQLSNISTLLISCYMVLVQVPGIFSNIKIEPRIVGGRNAAIKEVPFLVQIWTQEVFACGGTRASDRHIITVAHCVYRYPPYSVKVVAGVSRIGVTGISAIASKIIVHPDYSRKEHDLDIAVVILKSPLIGHSVGLPFRCDVPIQAGDNVQLFGWGKTSESYYFLPNQLQATTVRVIDQTKCQYMYRGKGVITESMFCAAWNGRDACDGDSGGPALIKGQFCGIISWGVSCDNPDYPGVYTRINNTEVLRFLFDAFVE